MNNDKATNQSLDGRKSQSDLQNRYGRIAISAVAAALTCGGEAKPRDAETKKRDHACGRSPRLTGSAGRRQFGSNTPKILAGCADTWP